MIFKLELACNNAAFDDGEGGKQEVIRILRDAIEKLDQGHDSAGLRDTNGNKVGSYIFTDAE